MDPLVISIVVNRVRLRMIPPAELEERFADDHRHGPFGAVEADRPALVGGAPVGLGGTPEAK